MTLKEAGEMYNRHLSKMDMIINKIRLLKQYLQEAGQDWLPEDIITIDTEDAAEIADLLQDYYDLLKEYLDKDILIK